ncbi:sterol desaturase family protein [Pedobacter sp. ISL-68]|uniref:sterol desaturase family protein n=1 Tax=unclassified Pedobacter TaxID=2628915 RepID=UPI001BE991CE|nr:MULTISPECIES: sterol desaturase family protein [unclassified Pedobacter]MBT2561619.1 sterol desaturase family protein [Pedobacter sp. ISL-64]MBT2591008.1 sterol desaturase family protein [Pedobacter sp. ISL-68]
MKVDYIALSVPVFFILIGIELAYNFYKKLNYYRLNDSIANLSQGIGQQLTGIFMKTALFFGYKYIFEHWRLFELPKTIWVWMLLFIGVDFFYYWFHRMSHEVNALWAAHIVHHQSEEYNLTVALRQSWFQGWFSWVFYLPLAFVGFDPIMFLTLSSFNTLYQFWIHTRAIKSMGFLEYILNTPSHHRVHHGSNPKYIDKNHAGTLIIWDRFFGTFQQEEEEVYYGITKPLASWNPVWANLHYWDDLVKTAKQSPKFSDKIKVFFKPPGWFPSHLGGFQSASEINAATYKKYNPAYQPKLTAYVLVQFLIALVAGSAILFSYTKMDVILLISGATFTILTLITCGALLEQKQWQLRFEYFRLTLGVLIVLFLKFPIGYQVIFVAMQLISVIWFFNLQKANPNPDED